MKDIERLIAETKFLFAKNFYEKIHSITKIKANKNDAIYEFLKLTRNPKELSAFILFDSNQNRKRLYAMLKTFCRSSKKINDKMLLSITDSLLNSYCTLLKVENISNNKILAYDKILKKNLEIENCKDKIKIKYIFVRVVEIDGYFYILDILEYIDEKFISSFIKNLYELILSALDISDIKSISKETKIKFLKEQLPSIYILLDACVKKSDIQKSNNLDASKVDLNLLFNKSDINIFKEFTLFAESKLNVSHEECLIFFNMIYVQSLKNIGENFSTIENFSFTDIFSKLVNNGLILTDSDLEIGLDILSNYYNFASKRNPVFNKTGKEIESISKHIFLYKNMLRKSTKGLYFDENLLDLLSDTNDFELLDKYSIFLDFINSSDVSLNKDLNMLTNSSVKKLADKLQIQPFKELVSPGQNHYPIIDFFYNFSIEKEFIKISPIGIELNQKVMDFLFLDKDEQFSVFVSSLFNENFLKLYLSEMRIKEALNILKIANTSIKEKKNIDISNIDENVKNHYIIYLLRDFGFVEIYRKSIGINTLGKKILAYYSVYDKNKVINFDTYKK